ncbi:hypothetical protein QQX10_07310 [Demequina sp. SYSU T00039]|uniref:Cobalt transporter n=1 Tax=Demequina lignilytica TaxID=3051663 RepID=A0AAW7M529_9MICO|nr:MULTISPECIES: hypothetical protein [unclassified Demequina]MDN4477676.1 hypothetical protein [Demequina sp. SYSU T00039-1]MDN4487973.1 hypothetical protein [Demequina sp. SYSU T00039]MDN4490413.1 hypothetical protein [Demequina sp. SYSU T00068]
MSRGRTAAAFGVLVAAAGGAAAGLYLWSEQRPAEPPTFRCSAVLGESTSTLTAEQAGYAALIAAVSEGRDLPARATTIALATAMQESSLRNLDYGDRDSLGLFQQRPSQGWGTEAEVQDPYYATGRFLDSLVRVDGWQDMEVTVAAQRVQRSAFPDAYARWETLGRMWASALRGQTGGVSVTCDVGEGDGTTPQDFADRIDADFGEDVYAVRVLDATDDDVWLDVAPTVDDAAARDALASWAVAVAAEESVAAVSVGGEGWTAADGLGPVDAPAGAIGAAIRLTLETPPG